MEMSMSDEKDQLVEALRQRDEARAEVERSLVALGSICGMFYAPIVEAMERASDLSEPR